MQSVGTVRLTTKVDDGHMHYLSAHWSLTFCSTNYQPFVVSLFATSHADDHIFCSVLLGHEVTLSDAVRHNLKVRKAVYGLTTSPLH